MDRDAGTRVKCPGCGWFLANVTSLTAEVELNCSNGGCRKTVVVRRENRETTVTVVSKIKQA